jgi:hypothetical protein
MQMQAGNLMLMLWNAASSSGQKTTLMVGTAGNPCLVRKTHVSRELYVGKHPDGPYQLIDIPSFYSSKIEVNPYSFFVWE